jgi:anti-sigma regulatory factor (Ser/Thr protein kinase)
MNNPAEPPGSTASIDLSGRGPRALGEVRRWVEQLLARLDRPHVEDVIQVTDELASNAFEHAGGPQVIHVTYHPTPCSVTVEVEDGHPAHPTLGQSRFGAGAHRGRGMVLVDRLAMSWGVRRPSPGHETKTVWAEVSCAEEPCAPENTSTN